MFQINTFNKQTKIIILGVSAILLVVIVASAGYYFWTGTPEYSIYQIKKAIQTHDKELGLKYIDTDAIFENLWTDMKTQLTNKTSQTSNGFEAFGMMLGLQLVENMKPTLKEQIKQGIANIFEEPKTDTNATQNTENKSPDIKSVWEQKDLKLKKQGDTAYIELPENIKIIFTKPSGRRYWVITKLEGYANNIFSNETEQKTTSATGSENKTTTPPKTTSTTPKTNNTPPKEEAALPKSESVPPTPVITTPTKIEGLASIRLSGGIWQNWDADAEKDGAVVDVVYLDNQGEIISSNETTKLPITADVKLFAADTSDFPYKKGRLVFSATYSKNQIILGNIYPAIRIPKEQISVNPDVDYQYGYATITIHTPEQGDFSDESDFVVLYEK